MADKEPVEKTAEQIEQERIAALSGNDRMNHAIRNSGNRETGDVNADIRRATGREAQS